MTRILLIQQYLGLNKEVGPIFPIGLAYLCSAIKNINWQIKVLDMNVCKNPYEDLQNLLLNFNPDVTAVSLRNIDNVDLENFNYFYLEFIKTISIISKSKSKIIVGGAGFSIFGEKIMETIPTIDFGISQEGEQTMIELLNALRFKNSDIPKIKGLYYRKQKNVLFTGQRTPLDFSKSAIPDRSFFDLSKYNKPLCMGVQTKRGCSLKCSYCTYPYLNHYSERFRNKKSVVDEIEMLHKKYGINEIIFCDDIFNNPLNHACEILLELKKRKLKIRWSAWFDIGNTNLDFIRLAITTGCYRFCFSIEAVTERSLKELRKNFNMKQISNLLRLIKKPEFKDIDFRFSIFALPPSQNIWGLCKTLRFVYNTHVSKKNIKCLVSWIRIYPHTAIYDSLNNKGIDLLPPSIDKNSTNTLFWMECSIPQPIIYFYKKILKSFNILRNFKKSHIW